jgi:hypothetical protein
MSKGAAARSAAASAKFERRGVRCGRRGGCRSASCVGPSSRPVAAPNATQVPRRIFDSPPRSEQLGTTGLTPQLTRGSPAPPAANVAIHQHCRHTDVATNQLSKEGSKSEPPSEFAPHSLRGRLHPRAWPLFPHMRVRTFARDFLVDFPANRLALCAGRVKLNVDRVRNTSLIRRGN